MVSEELAYKIAKLENEKDLFERERIAFDIVEISKRSDLFIESEGAYQLGKFGFKEKESAVINDMNNRYPIAGELVHSINKYVATPIANWIIKRIEQHNL